MLSETDVEDHYNPYVRLIEIEKNNSQCGFKLTRGKWDPYPWVSDVDEGTAAFMAGLKPGDCVLEVNGKDVVGMKICDIAEIVKSENAQVSLLLWNAGVEPHCTPEAICCGPLPKNLQRLSACMSKILAFLECPVCLDTIPPPAYQCDNGHLICMKCRAKSEKCPVCRQRLHRGRSLVSDQIYHAVTDTFGLKEDNEETRASKIQQIFKRKKNDVPDIKVTPTYTNKFLSRIVGKSSSVDNLSSPTCLNNEAGENIFSETYLKTKSLSTNEIFLPESSVISRSGSVSRINKKQLQTLSVHYNNYIKPASFHGSFENLERKLRSTVPEENSMVRNQSEEEEFYNCPFQNNCNEKIRETELFDHFRNAHGENGPLVQYFSSNIRYQYKDFKDHTDLCHMISADEIFFLKMIFSCKEDCREIMSSPDILLWVWYFGEKRASQTYEATIELKNTDENILFRANIPVFSLMSTSTSDVLDFKKGAFISSTSLESLEFYSGKGFLDLKIVNTS